MLTDKELGEAWFGSEAEVKHLKAVLKLKETHILTLRVYSNTQKKRDKETPKREEERRLEERGRPEKVCVDWRW